MICIWMVVDMENNENVIKTNNEVNEAIEHYYHLKQQESEIKNELDAYNKLIKDYALSNDLENIEYAGYKANVSKRIKTSWVEPILIEKLKKLGYSELVKTKEYVDLELLENYIYTKQIKEARIKDCKNEMEIIILKVSEVRK